MNNQFYIAFGIYIYSKLAGAIFIINQVKHVLPYDALKVFTIPYFIGISNTGKQHHGEYDKGRRSQRR
jgi:hypothetical protein